MRYTQEEVDQAKVKFEQRGFVKDLRARGFGELAEITFLASMNFPDEDFEKFLNLFGTHLEKILILKKNNNEHKQS